MVRHVDAIFSQGMFRPTQPVTLPEGTRVQLSIEELLAEASPPCGARIYTPRLVHAEDVADFAMEVREASDAGI